jgi:type I restriction enzyme R subunit
MLTGELRNQIDRIWDAFWSGGISNPLEVIEQITYLLFQRRLDDPHTLEENKATRMSTLDMEERERMLAAHGVGSAEQIQRAREESHGLGVFVRSLIGLDREAAKQVFATFLTGKTLNSNQIEFVNLVIDHLTENGVLDPGILYESPFTDLSPQGPDGLFSSSQVYELVAALERVSSVAVAA